MQHSTTEPYQLQREIFHFTEEISAGANRDWQKFTSDMIFGILASGSGVLSRIADPLQESIQKKNTIWHLSRKLTEYVPTLSSMTIT